MLPYYLNLNKRLISNELSETLLEIAKNHIDNFINYRGQLTGRKDGNSFLSPFGNANFFNHSEIEELKNMVSKVLHNEGLVVNKSLV